MDLTNYIPHALTGILSVATVGTVNHFIAKAQSLLPDTLGQLIKLWITNQPIRAQLQPQQAAQPQEKGTNDMWKFLEDLEAALNKGRELAPRVIEHGLADLDILANFASKAAPVAAAIAPMTGSAAPAVAAGAAAAEAIAPMVHEAIQAIPATDGNGNPIN